MSGEIERVGLEFVALDKGVTRSLRNWDKLATQLQRKITGLNAAFSSFDKGTLRSFTHQAALVSRVTAGMRSAGHLGRQNLQLAKEKAKVDLAGVRTESAAIKLERQKFDFQRKMQREEETQQRRKQSFLYRYHRTQRRWQQQQNAEQLRSYRAHVSEQMRMIRLSQQRAKAEAKVAQASRRELTADQEILKTLAERGLSGMPGPGNRIAFGMGMARAGFGGLKAMAALPKSNDVQRLLHEQAGLAQMNLGAGQTRLALRAATRMQSAVPGVDKAEAIDLVKDAILTFGKNKNGKISAEALDPAVLKRMAQFAVVNQTAYGLSSSQFYSAMKGSEFMTKNKKGMTDAERKQAFLGSLELEHKILGGLGGKIKPSEVLQFLRRSQSAKYSLTPEGLLHLVPVMQEANGSQTGRQLMSLMQNLANVRMNTQSATEMLHMGLLKRGSVTLNRIGMVRHIKPGAVTGSDMLRSDPVKWVEHYLMPVIKNRTKGLSPTEATARTDQIISSILSDRTAASLVSTIVNQDQRIHKDYRGVAGARGINASDIAQRKTYLRAERDYDAAMSTLRQNLGLAVLPTVTRWTSALAGALGVLNGVMSRHPIFAKLGALAAGLGSLALGLGGIAWVIKNAWTAVKTLKGIETALEGLRFAKFGGTAVGESLQGVATGGAEATGALAAGGVAMEGVAGGAAATEEAVGGIAEAAEVAFTPMEGAVAGILTGIEGIAAFLGGPVTIAVAAVAGGALLLKTNFLGARNVAVGLLHVLHGGLERVFGGIGAMINKNFPWIPAAIGAVGGAAQGFQAWTMKGSQGFASWAAKWDKSGAPKPEKPTAAARAALNRAASSPRPGVARGVPTHHSITVPVALTVNGHVHPDQAHAIAKEAGARGGRMIQDHVEDLLKTNRPTRSTPWQDR